MSTSTLPTESTPMMSGWKFCVLLGRLSLAPAAVLTWQFSGGLTRFALIGVLATLAGGWLGGWRAVREMVGKILLGVGVLILVATAGIKWALPAAVASVDRQVDRQVERVVPDAPTWIPSWVKDRLPAQSRP